MLRILLLCSLFYIALAKVDEFYKGEECKTRLDPKDYVTGIKCIFGFERNGNPHYLWGINYPHVSVLYCARVTSDWQFFGRVNLKLWVPANVVKGKIIRLQVIDRKAPDKGGNVEILEGGVDQDFVVLSFQSVLLMSMDYAVVILGKPLRL